MSEPRGKVAILGSGMVGRNWAIIFSSFGYQVQLYDIKQELAEKARDIIEADLKDIHASGTKRGNLTLEQQVKLLSVASSLEECLKSVIHVQESIFEDMELKQSLHKQVDDALEENNTAASIASSSSFGMPSIIFKNVTKHIEQCLVAHPINPPLYIRLVELVRQPKTSEATVTKVRNLMLEVGQKPVVLQKEINGFALNVMQSAVLHHAFNMIADGILSPEDVDTVVTEGLGPRYAFIGPWMTGHLNATGIADYLERYSDGLYSVLTDRPQIVRMQGPVADRISEALKSQVPIEKLQDKRLWRDQCLKELDSTKTKLG